MVIVNVVASIPIAISGFLFEPKRPVIGTNRDIVIEI